MNKTVILENLKSHFSFLLQCAEIRIKGGREKSLTKTRSTILYNELFLLHELFLFCANFSSCLALQVHPETLAGRYFRPALNVLRRIEAPLKETITFKH